MSAGSELQYSTLELASNQPQYDAYRHGKPIPTDPGKQVVPEDGKEHARDDSGLEIAEEDDRYGLSHSSQVTKHMLWTKKRILLCAVIGLICVLAAVLGGVLGSRHQNSSTALSTGSPTASPTTPSPNSSSTVSQFPLPIKHGIAAVSFVSDFINNTRVYFQDDIGHIIEASSSGQDSTWSTTDIGIDGKNSSALAAAVSRPGEPLEISIFYLDAHNKIHDAIYSSLTSAWASGTLSTQSYIALPNSSLTALYDWCALCANTTILAFQDVNGFIQIANLSSTGWALNQLGQDLDPQWETGLALQPFYREGMADQINLYYQKSAPALNMTLASWKPAAVNNGVDGWSLNEQTYAAFPPSSPIAAASSYTNISAGMESWIEVLSLSDIGVAVSTWVGELNDWKAYFAHPSPMANSSSNARVYGSVAVTAVGSAFAVVVVEGQKNTVEEWRVEDDLLNWKFVGNVDLSGAWGIE